jgi:hypothetical protein
VEVIFQSTGDFMSTPFKFAAIAAASIFAFTAHAGVSFDANIEHNITKASKKDADSGGRVELNAHAEMVRQGDHFINAKATLEVPTGSGDVGIADAWVQFGTSAVDLRIGRQEAADLFPLGKDVVVEAADGAIGGYRANKLRGRVTTGALHAVVGFNAGPGLRAEMGLVTKKDDGYHGIRPTVVYSAGDLTLRAGFESIKQDGNDSTKSGYGVSAGYAFGHNASLNINYAKSSKLKGQSFGVNANFGDAGFGFVQDKDNADNRKVDTFYAAYTFPLFGLNGASITPAISHSKATNVNDNVTALRVRFNYAF